MDPVSLTASITAILQLTSAVVGYLNDVKDAPKERARCATEASNLFNLLTNLRYRLEEADTNQAWYTAICALAIQGGPLDQYKSELEDLQPKVSSGSGITKIGNALLWKFSKQEVNVILSRMERLKGLVHIALEMDHFKLSQAIKTSIETIHNSNQAIKDDTSVIRQAIPPLETGVNTIQQEQKRQRHRIITDWISPIDFAAQQSDVISRRQERTGLWFTSSPEFISWLHGSNQTLFCPGIPGAGKTMIAAIVVDHLWRHIKNEDIGVAYIYCNYKAQADQTITHLVSTILKQLIQERPSIIEPVETLYNYHINRRTRPSLEEFLGALRAVVSNYSKVYVVIDALDECLDHDSSRSQLLVTLRNLQSKENINLMVTSRDVPEVVQKFRLSPVLEIRASDSDVKRFVAGRIHQLPGCVQRDDELQEAIQDSISTAVDGMFLLARLHVDSLRDKRTKKKILLTLDGLPKGSKALDEAYNDAIKRIESQLPEDSILARRILSWITYAQRRLTTGELRHALAVEPGDTELDLDNAHDVEDMVSICAGLVTIDDESNIIRLVHYTTQEYFERNLESWNPRAQQEIASACLTYLSLDPFRSGSCPNDKEFESRLEKNMFLDYASRYWGQHARTVQEQVYGSASRFLQDIALVSCAVQTMSISESDYVGYKSLLSEIGGNFNVAADSKDIHGRTPLWMAAEQGHEAVVKLLVERDDVAADSTDGLGRTPLSWAARRGHEAVVKLLVERNDVAADSTDRGGRTPLWMAADGGHEAVVKLLVERDDVAADSMDVDGQTPLSRAAARGREAVVKLLRSKGS